MTKLIRITESTYNELIRDAHYIDTIDSIIQKLLKYKNLERTTNNTDIFLKHKEFSTQTCNALGCYNTATLKIVLPVGAKSLTIFVCQTCKLKFEN